MQPLDRSQKNSMPGNRRTFRQPRAAACIKCFFKNTFNESVSTLVERKVRGWLSGVLDDMRRHSPVQQWLDSLPGDIQPTGSSAERDAQAEKIEATDVIDEAACPLEEEGRLEVPARDMSKRKSLESGLVASTPRAAALRSRLQRDHSLHSEGHAPKTKNPLLRDYSLQSDGSGSSGSSVLNVLGARQVDAESLLIALGFGPSERQQKHQRIPERFLVPSKLNGISTEKFIKDEHHSMRMHDCGVLGYRGLTGSPHVPPSTIVAKIMERISQRDLFREPEGESSPPTPRSQSVRFPNT